METIRKSKMYRVVYYFNSMVTERTVSEKRLESFLKEKEGKVINVEEVE